MKSDEFHVERLKLAKRREEPFSVTDPLQPPDDGKAMDEFHVEKIISFEQRTHGKKFLVKWEGYPDSENTWEWEWSLDNAQERLREFMKTNPSPVNPARRSRRLNK